MFNELVKSIALLLALCFLHGMQMRWWPREARGGRTASGLLFGTVCAIGMLAPVVSVPGAAIDVRTVVLSLAGVFGGPLVALIAAAMAAAARLWIGGAGTPAGLLVIALSATLGCAFRWAHLQGKLSIRPLHLLGLAVVVHVLALGVATALPSALALSTHRGIILPLLLLLSLPLTALVGWLLQDVENRLATERALRESTARLHAVTHAISDGLLVLDERGTVLEVLSPDHTSLLAPPAQLRGRRLQDALPPEQAAQWMALLYQTLASGQAQHMAYRIDTPQGPRCYEGRAHPLGLRQGGLRTVVFAAHDTTEQQQTLAALRESELRFRTLLHDIPSISVQGYLPDRTTTYWNKASEQLYGYTEQEAVGKNLLDLIIPPAMHEVVRQATDAMFRDGTPIPAGELRLQRKDGSQVDVFSSHARIDVPGQAPELFCIDIDITGRKAAEEQVHYMAYFDPLTGLPNRRLLTDRLQQVLAGSARTGLNAAVLFIDLDQFKTLNDSRGHEVGDQLLVETARRLQACVRSQDTVARLGGDEFVVVLHNLSTDTVEAAAQVRALGDKMLCQLRQPYLVGGQEHHVTASVGATMLDPDQASVEDLLKQADLAMYRAKDEGRNTLRFFDPVMQASVNQRVLLEAEMHRGLRNHEFVLYYQPQVNAEGTIVGAEVLVRWLHPGKGLIPPGVFIPLAEETGLILPLGRWVLETALHQQAHWRTDARMDGLNLSVNVSARQFRQDVFVSELRDLLRASGANPRRIKLELTESLLLQDVDGVIALMQELRALGLGLSLDDFGTGYSSLGYLKRLPLDQIKIDQGFVRGVLLDPKDAAIAHSIVTLAHSLGLGVIAEGVETEAHHRFLLEHGCRDFQGYLFGRPEPLELFEQRVHAQQTCSALK